MIWRLYPIALLLGGFAASAVALFAAILAGFAAAAIGIDVTNFESLRRPDVAAVVLLISIASFAVAGYIAARFAPGEELINAIAIGALLMVINHMESGELPIPLWLRISSLLLAVPCALLGGYVYRGREPVAQQAVAADGRSGVENA